MKEYAVKYLNMLLDGIKDQEKGTIVHICGQMRSVYEQIDKVHSGICALSFRCDRSIERSQKESPRIEY